MFHPNYYRYFSHNNNNKKKNIDSITSKKINDLYQFGKSTEINRNNNLISNNTNKNERSSYQETKNETQININTKKIIPKIDNIYDFTKFVEEEKINHKIDDNINSKKENLNEKINNNKEKNTCLKAKNQKHKKNNNNNQINHHLFINRNSNTYKKLNTVLNESTKFNSKILELSYALKNIKTKIIKKTKNIK